MFFYNVLMSEKKPLPAAFSALVKKITKAYTDEILEPAETAIREWLEEVSSDENPYCEDKIAKIIPLCTQCYSQMASQDGCFICNTCGTTSG
jgi:hypothetical protein